ncbi:COPI associated protein [Plasmodiophora brassicae]
MSDQAAPMPAPAAGPTYSDRVRTIEPRKLALVIRISSILVALLLTVVGITGLLSGDGTIDVTYYLFAFYTTVFAITLFIFELRIKYFDLFAANNFGFMFNYGGRSLFLLFLGSMTFSLNPAKYSIPAGIVTLIILGINFFILCASPNVGTYLTSVKPPVHKIPPVDVTSAAVDFVVANPNAAKKAVAMSGHNPNAVDVIAANPNASKKMAQIAANNKSQA